MDGWMDGWMDDEQELWFRVLKLVPYLEICEILESYLKSPGLSFSTLKMAVRKAPTSLGYCEG